MERALVVRGVLAGAVAGLIALIFARIFAEPQIAAAISYEAGRETAQAALDRAAGLPAEPAEAEMFSRAVQATIGVGVGVVLFGVALGLLFAVVFSVTYGRLGRPHPRGLAMVLAGLGFAGVYLVPFVKYPANPPAIGHADTIAQRTALYLILVACSLVALGAAIWLGRRLSLRLGGWNAGLVAGGAFIVGIGLVMLLLPPVGHLAPNVAAFGRQPTETPLPLRDSAGVIVYPGFPADVLYRFRAASLATQFILWLVIGLIFGALAGRLTGRTTPVGPARAARIPPGR